jgi:ATP synthase protein I
MVRAIFEGRPAGLPAREEVASMVRDPNRPRSPAKADPKEADLNDRLRRLGERLEPATAEQGAKEAGSGGDPGGLGKAMRISTEFVAGVIAGAFLGWVVDRLLGTSPWGMIVLLMLGFGAGVMNMMRAAGMAGGWSSGKK